MFLQALQQSLLYCAICLLCTISPSSASPSPISLNLANCTIPETHVDSWGVSIDLAGTTQHVCVSPSTVTNSTLVISADFCNKNQNFTTSSQCESLCGNTFNIGLAESSSSYSSSSPSAVLALNPVWDDLSGHRALLAGTTSMQPTLAYNFDKYPIGIITGGNNQNVGHLGLANGSDFLHAFLSKGYIPENGFGLDAGSQSLENPRNGRLVLGGYDLASILGPVYDFEITTALESSERQCPLYVTITSITLHHPQAGGNQTDKFITSPGENVPACIEPYDNLFRLPSTPLQRFKESTNWRPDTNASTTLHIAEPGLYYPQGALFDGSLTLEINNKFKVDIPSSELSSTLRGINEDGVRVLQQNITEVKIFNDTARFNTATLGKIFLSQVYLIVDYSTNKFQLAKLGPNRIPNIVAFVPSTPKSKLSTGAIVGIAIGSVVGTAAIVAIILGCCFRDKIRSWRERTLPGKKISGIQAPLPGPSHLGQLDDDVKTKLTPTPPQNGQPSDILGELRQQGGTPDRGSISNE